MDKGAPTSPRRIEDGLQAASLRDDTMAGHSAYNSTLSNTAAYEYNAAASVSASAARANGHIHSMQRPHTMNHGSVNGFDVSRSPPDNKSMSA